MVNKKNKIKLLSVNNVLKILLILSIALFIFASLDMMQASFWRDEAFTAKLISGRFFDVIKIMAGDFAPFLHPLLLWPISRVLGSSELALRALSFISTLGAVFYLRALFKEKTAKDVATILYFVSFLTYYYAAEARYYALFTFLVIASYYYTVNFFTNKKSHKFLFILFNILSLYTHTIALFTYASNALIVFIKALKKKQVNWKNFTLDIAPAVLYIPWLVILLGQFKSLEDNPFWLKFDPWFSLRDNILSLYFWPKFGGFDIIRNLTSPLAMVVAALMALTLVGILILALRKKYAPLIGGLLPLLLVYLMSFKQALFYIRYIAFVYPFLVLYMTVALSRIASKKFMVLLLSVFVVFYGHVFFKYYYGQRKPHYREIGQYIKDNFNLGEYKVVNDTEFSYFSCDYYIGNCLIAKQKADIANVGLVLIDEKVALTNEQLKGLDKFVMISWNPEIKRDRKELSEFKQVQKTKVYEFYIYAFNK